MWQMYKQYRQLTTHSSTHILITNRNWLNTVYDGALILVTVFVLLWAGTEGLKYEICGEDFRNKIHVSGLQSFWNHKIIRFWSWIFQIVKFPSQFIYCFQNSKSWNLKRPSWLLRQFWIYHLLFLVVSANFEVMYK